jgi:hypothetical protein
MPSIAATKPDLHAAGDAERRELDDTADGGSRARFAAPRRIARRFIAAFARYQAGRLGEPTAGQLRALATAELATYLLAQPPRGGTAPYARVRVERLDLTGPESGPVKAATLLAYRRGRRSLFEVQLERLDGRWRVSQLYPSEG